jgi:hypothetical protein
MLNELTMFRYVEKAIFVNSPHITRGPVPKEALPNADLCLRRQTIPSSPSQQDVTRDQKGRMNRSFPDNQVFRINWLSRINLSYSYSRLDVVVGGVSSGVYAAYAGVYSLPLFTTSAAVCTAMLVLLSSPLSSI